MFDVLTIWDWTIIATYLLFMLGVGLYFTRRASQSSDDFFLSGRNLPWWLAGTSMVATTFASDTPLVITGWIRNEGLNGLWLMWGFAIGHILNVFIFSKLWRRAEVTTDVELTELRYDGTAAAWLRGIKAFYLAVPVHCITMAWVIVAMIKFLNVLFNIDGTTAIYICVGLATFYSALSGLWGVTVTDLIQFCIAMIGTIILAIFSIKHFGSLETFQQELSKLTKPALHFFPFLPEGTPFFSKEFWQGPILAFSSIILVQWWANKNADGGGIFIQRMSATKNERHALLSILWFNFAHYVLRPWPWILVALASILIFPNVSDPEAAYPMMIKKFMPSPLLGLMVMTFLAAFMSTIDSTTNLSSAYLVNDIYKRFLNPTASEKHCVWVARLCNVIVMIISCVIASLFDSISDLFKFLLAFSSGIGGIYILRWFWWRINAYSEIVAILTSSILVPILYHKTIFSYPTILLISVASSIIASLSITIITKPTSRDHLQHFYNKVKPFGFWKPLAKERKTPKSLRQIINWIVGSAGILSSSFALGKFLLGFPGQAKILATIAIFCIAYIVNQLRKQ